MRFLKFIFLLSGLFILCGCWDYNELNMQELVTAAGVSQSEESVTVTVETAEGKVYETEGKSFYDAVRAATSEIGKKLYWGHLELLVLDETSDIDEAVNTLLHAQDVYPDISAVMIKGASAKKLMTELEMAGAKISDILKNSENSKRFRALPLWKLRKDDTEESLYLLPVAEFYGGKLFVSGSAVIKDGRLREYLSGEQTQILGLMTEPSPGGNLPPIPVGGEEVSLEILAAKTEKRKREDGLDINMEITVSSSDVSKNPEETEMFGARYVETSARELVAFAEAREITEIFDFEPENAKISVKIKDSGAGMLRRGEEK